VTISFASGGTVTSSEPVLILPGWVVGDLGLSGLGVGHGLGGSSGWSNTAAFDGAIGVLTGEAELDHSLLDLARAILPVHKPAANPAVTARPEFRVAASSVFREPMRSRLNGRGWGP
jgi:hypothetical protein